MCQGGEAGQELLFIIFRMKICVHIGWSCYSKHAIIGKFNQNQICVCVPYKLLMSTAFNYCSLLAYLRDWELREIRFNSAVSKQSHISLNWNELGIFREVCTAL